jgi:hypothetical protein
MIQIAHHGDTLALAQAYARAVDERDLELLAKLFTYCRGPDDFERFCERLVALKR